MLSSLLIAVSPPEGQRAQQRDAPFPWSASLSLASSDLQIHFSHNLGAKPAVSLFICPQLSSPENEG